MIIEAALVFPLIVVFLAGTIDFGVGFRDRMPIQSAMRNGARGGAGAVAAPNADQLALSTFYAGLASASTHRHREGDHLRGQLGRASGEPSTSCQAIAPRVHRRRQLWRKLQRLQRNAGGELVATFGGAPTYLVGTTVVIGLQQRVEPVLVRRRGVEPERTYGQPRQRRRFVGLYAEVSYEPFTGVFATSAYVITDWTVMRLEPAPG